jgi:hypothetical protein
MTLGSSEKNDVQRALKHALVFFSMMFCFGFRLTKPDPDPLLLRNSDPAGQRKGGTRAFTKRLGTRQTRFSRDVHGPISNQEN